MSEITVWFHPTCSKCRAVREILENHGVKAHYREYLQEPPSLAEAQTLWLSLGTASPASLLRSKEAVWEELSLEGGSPEQLLQALVDHPELLNRPVVQTEGRAVVARPPERVLEFLQLKS